MKKLIRLVLLPFAFLLVTFMATLTFFVELGFVIYDKDTKNLSFWKKFTVESYKNILP